MLSVTSIVTVVVLLIASGLPVPQLGSVLPWQEGPGRIAPGSPAFLLGGSENTLATLLLCLGAMSLAGAQGNLWSVEGGNKLVCSGLLKLTKANVIHATVTSVTLHSTGNKSILAILAKPILRVK